MTCPNGHTYDKRYDGFKKGDRCKECRKLSYDDVKKYIEDNNYILLADDYLGYHAPLEVKCPKGHVTRMQYANFKHGKRCRICANNVRHSYEYVKEFIESEEGYQLLSTEYINWETKLNIKCNKGHLFDASFNSFQSGHRCPYCNRSIGEERISNFLIKNNILFEPQYIFKDCKDKWFLRFDFYIPYINITIEYDGRHHYELVNFGGSCTKEELEEILADIQRKDKIKTDYCETKNINLIRIPYWDLDNIEQILTDKLLN